VDLYTHAFVTSALGGEEWSVSRSDDFTSAIKASVSIVYEISWVPESVWMQWR